MIVIDGLHGKLSLLHDTCISFELHFPSFILWQNTIVDCQIAGRQSNIRICSFGGSCCCSRGLGRCSERKILNPFSKLGKLCLSCSMVFLSGLTAAHTKFYCFSPGFNDILLMLNTLVFQNEKENIIPFLIQRNMLAPSILSPTLGI